MNPINWKKVGVAIASVVFVVLGIWLIVIIINNKKGEGYAQLKYDRLGEQLEAQAPAPPAMEMNMGGMSVTQQLVDSEFQDNVLQSQSAEQLSNTLDQIQINQINDIENVQNTNLTQKMNQTIQKVKYDGIYSSGMTKKPGLTEFQSQQQQAVKSYQWEDGEYYDDAYTNILGMKTNSAASITNNNMIINANQYGDSYVPGPGRTQGKLLLQ